MWLYSGDDKWIQGLDLVEMEIHNIVVEAVTKTIPHENKCKNAKCLSEKALQIAEKRREVKDKGEWGKYSNGMQSSRE